MTPCDDLWLVTVRTSGVPPRSRLVLTSWTAFVTGDWIDRGAARVAHVDGRVVGALAVGPAPGYVPAADRPELYLEAFVTSRAYAGRGVGRQLLAAVIRQATCRTRGVDQPRVCRNGSLANSRVSSRAGHSC
jgi:GNAT superfamily N-acetyltransferase